VLGEDLGQAGRGEGVGIVAGAMNRARSHRDHSTVKGGGNLRVIPV
jgi:hypothetical protein